MSADDLSASGRWARDPYVQALEEQLKKLGFKEDELKQLKKDAKAKKGGSRVQPLTFEEVRARRIEAYLKAEQDPRFTIPVEVSLRSTPVSSSSRVDGVELTLSHRETAFRAGPSTSRCPWSWARSPR